MRKEVVVWLYAPCVTMVLKYLAVVPRIPMQLRALTGIPGNYINRILKRLEFYDIVECLTPERNTGKVFYIKPKARELVKKVLRESGYNLEIRPLPDLKWEVYGMLHCNSCRSLKKIFDKALLLKYENVDITEPALEVKLRGSEGILETSRCGIYKSLRMLKNLGIFSAVKSKRKLLEYRFTEDGLALAEFITSQPIDIRRIQNL